MSTVPDKFNGYFEIIEDFDFRVEGAIKIPKEVRKFAYTLSVDIEIQSTIGNDYLNGKSSPSHGFFGYVVLVFRDYSVREIPISLARQNLYYGRVDEAYVNWYSLYLSSMASANLLAISQLQLVPIGQAVGLEVGAPLEQSCLDWSGFVELPLREVYVKTRFGTRFKLEVSRWEPIPANYGGCAYDGESKIIDDDEKDDGLPDETQPQTTDPSDPYEGFDPPTSAEELGTYFNPKQATIDNPNSANAPSTESLLYDVTVYAQDYINGCAGGLFEIFIPFAVGLTEPPQIETPITNNFTACGVPYQTVSLRVNGNQVGLPTGIASTMTFGVQVYSESEPITDDFYYGFRPVQ